jgi:molybdate transport system substrate-binding protein
MNKVKFLFSTVIFCLICISTIGCINKDDFIELNISASMSLMEAINEIQITYEEEHPEISLKLNFGATGSLQRQIEQGAPVDIFLSADKKRMEDLKVKGFLFNDKSIDLLKNEVVLIVPIDSSVVSSFEDLMKNEVEYFAMGEPESVPAGKYAQEVMTNLNLADSILPKTVFAKDVKEVLTWVESEVADAGIVYYTDALSSNEVKIVEYAQDGSHSAIIYPAAVIKDCKFPIEANDFVSFLASEEAMVIFKKYGFKL